MWFWFCTTDVIHQCQTWGPSCLPEKALQASDVSKRMIWRSRGSTSLQRTTAPASEHRLKQQSWWNCIASGWLDGTKPFLYVFQTFSLHFHWVLGFAISCCLEMYRCTSVDVRPLLCVKRQMIFLLILFVCFVLSFISGGIYMSFEDNVTEWIQT